MEPAPVIVIVDYGVGNLASVANMLRKAGAEAKVSGDRAETAAADKLLLPGVGHFDHGMKKLRGSDLVGVLEEQVFDKSKPLLGICLGSQILGKGSEEGTEPGLGWIDMVCRRLPESPGVRVPHMGWNRIALKRASPLFPALERDTRYYFVHSYYMDCADPGSVVATAHHGIEFTCAVDRDHIHGVQFHPEKSLRHGLALMKAFADT